MTGVSRFLGGHVAARLAGDPSIERLIGVDTVSPGYELRRAMGRTEFVRADIRNPVIARIISDTQPDTVVHTAVSPTPYRPGGRRTMKELNVIGTMQLLAACRQSPAVSRLVIKSSGAVYGAGPRDPAVFTEDHEPGLDRATGYGRDAAEIESYVRGFARRREDVTVTVLRFCNILGPQIDSVLTRFFALPVVPTVLGYDARLQLVHEQDAVSVLARSACEHQPGVFNVAARGVLLLSQAVRRAGRVPVPVLDTGVSVLGTMLRNAGLVDYSPEQVRFLNFGRVLDTDRLRTRFGFEPNWSTEQAFADYVAGQGLRPVIDPAQVAAVERTVLELARRVS